LYYSAEGVYRFGPRLYSAARYSAAEALHLVVAGDTTRDVRSNGIMHRFQLGGGYWVHQSILTKSEYVHQFADGFSPDGSQASGVDAWLDPRFNGVLVEISFSF
jgi:hypothetical protein